MNHLFETLASEDFRKSAGVFAQLLKACSTVNGENISTIQSSCLYNPLNIHNTTSHESPQQNSGYPRYVPPFLTPETNNSPPTINRFSNKGQTASSVTTPDTYCNSPVLKRQTNISTAHQHFITLFCWCPLVDKGGECVVAGLCHTSQSTLPCSFTVTAKVESVLKDGRCVVTEDGNEYRLSGGICWSVYNAVTLDMTIDTLPSDIAYAFSAGFPAVDWKLWIRNLLNYINGSNESVIDDSTIESQTVKECSMKTFESVVSRRDVRMPSPDISESTTDISTLKDSFACTYSRYTPDGRCKTGFRRIYNNQACSPSRRNRNIENRSGYLTNGRQSKARITTDSRKSRTLYEDDSSGPESTVVETGSQATESVSHRARLVGHFQGRKVTNNYLDEQYEVPHRSKKNAGRSYRRKSRMPDDQSPPKRSSTEANDRRTTMSTNRRKAPKPHHLNQMTDDKHNEIEEQYRLYTNSGQILDARNLPSTRSGRLIIPTLDLRFGQTLEIDQNRVVSVRHDLDDTASWILRHCNEPIPR